MTPVEALDLHGRLSQELADKHRDRGQVSAAETEAKVSSYMTSRSQSIGVTEREMVAKAAGLHYTKERVLLDAEICALDAQVAHLTLVLAHLDLLVVGV